VGGPIIRTRQIREEYLRDRSRERQTKKRQGTKFDARNCGCLYVEKKLAIPCLTHTEKEE
jgi:hypothetical protein